MAMHWNTRHWWFHRALHTMFYCFGFIFVSCTPISQPSAELSGTPPDQKDCTLGGLPETLVYGNVAHQSALAQLTSCQRQALIMDAEGMAVSWPQRAMPGGRQFASGLIKQTLRGLLVPRQEIEVLGVEWVTDHYDPVTVPTLLREIETSAGFQSSGDRVQIPIHPTTQKQHPLIQKLIDKGHPVRDMGQVTATMSRSLWNTKPAGSGRLVTIKMGSDFVHGTKSPNKLLDVGQDIKDLETQTLETSIADYMATLDVGYLVDQAAVTIKDRSSSDKAPDYTVAMRD